jgi:perosamine synthetase
MNRLEADQIYKAITAIYKKKPIYLSEPVVNDFEISLIVDQLKKNKLALGDYNKKFEKFLKKLTGSNNVILTSNGTVSLFASLLISGVDNSQEVLVPSFNYIASINAILLCNSTPHFVDSSKETFGIDYKKLDIYLKKNFKIIKGSCYNEKTQKFIKILLITHPFGNSDDIKEALKICKKYNLELIEDASEAIGSFYKKKHLGTFGKIGVLSFNGNKTITSAGGGAILVKNKKEYHFLKSFINNGRVENKNEFLYKQLGLNFRMPNLNATLGFAQSFKLKQIVKFKRKINKIYKELIPKKYKLLSEIKNSKSNFWLNTLILNNNNEKKLLLSFLKKNKIYVRSTWRPLHTFDHLKNFPKMNLENSLEIYNRSLNLPSGYISKFKY